MKREIYSEILKKLDDELVILKIDLENVLERAEKGIKLTKQALKDVKDLVTDHEFESAQSEITFFKKTKPRLFSKLIYFVKIFDIESKRPRSSNKSQIKYLNRHIDKLQNYFNDNLEFYQYYRRNATSLDEHYFLRGLADVRSCPDTFHFFTDEQFSTSHDSTVATILAFDLLIIYLKKEIELLEKNNDSETGNQSIPKQSKLLWTGNKTDLIELIYALHSCGVINRGTTGIKEIAAAVEQLFNVNLGNYYHTFIEIRSRKSNLTKFLDILKESLLKRSKESDK